MFSAPTNLFHWHPRSDSAVVLRAGNAAPLDHFVPQQKPCEMKEISTKQVIDAMEMPAVDSDKARLMSQPTPAKKKPSFWITIRTG